MPFKKGIVVSMKKKIIIFIVLILLIILVTLGFAVFNKAMDSMAPLEAMEYGEGEIIEEPFEDFEEENTISGSGSITSFNIEKLETTIWSKVDKVLVNNEDVVNSGQEILNVSNDEATGKIYSTISGKIFIEDSKFGKSYTIYDLNNLGFEMQVDEEKMKDLKIGQKVETRLVATNEIVYGRICYISQIPQDEQIKIKVKLENNDKLRIGYSVKATVMLDEEVDTNIPIYDIKNSIPKIGKTTINYKSTGQEIGFSSIEEIMDNNEIMAMYESALEEQANIIEELTAQLEALMELAPSEEEIEIPEQDIEQVEEEKVDIEEISKKYNDYWKNYYEELYSQNEETISVRESEKWKEYWENKYNELVGNNAVEGNEEE